MCMNLGLFLEIVIQVLFFKKFVEKDLEKKCVVEVRLENYLQIKLNIKVGKGKVVFRDG